MQEGKLSCEAVQRVLRLPARCSVYADAVEGLRNAHTGKVVAIWQTISGQRRVSARTRAFRTGEVVGFPCFGMA